MVFQEERAFVLNQNFHPTWNEEENNRMYWFDCHIFECIPLANHHFDHLHARVQYERFQLRIQLFRYRIDLKRNRLGMERKTWHIQPVRSRSNLFLCRVECFN